MKYDFIIPAYNAELTISRAVKSIPVNDLVKNIIIVNDGSTDLTETIIHKMNNKKIKLINLENNLGPAGARNTGIASATAEWVLFLDADDLCEQNRILNIDSQTASVDFVCGNYRRLINNLVLTDPIYKTDISKFMNLEELLKNNYVACGSVGVKRKVLEELNGFDSSFRIAEDYELWLRIFEKYKVSYIHKVLYYYSVNNKVKTLTSSVDSYDKMIEALERIKIKWKL